MTETKLRVMTDLIERNCASLRQQGLSLTTIDSRRDLLRRMDADLPMGLEEATVEELTDWLVGPPPRPDKKGWSRSTRATYYAHVKAFYDWACDERNPHLSWNPAAALTRPSVPAGEPNPVTDEEKDEAIRTAGPWRVAIILAAYAGLRCCELASITRRDVNRLTLTVVGKGDKTRVIPTADDVWEAVSGLSGKLVPGGAREISGRTLRHFEKVGLPGVTMHRFRHWFATTMLASGKVDLKTVSELLGHASTATTARYCLISDRQRASAVATLPVLAPAST